MIKLDVIKMLHTMHQAGVVIKADPTWTREEWVNYVIHQFNMFCMPPAWVTANETAQLCCTYRFGKQPWQKAFKPGQTPRWRH